MVRPLPSFFLSVLLFYLYRKFSSPLLLRSIRFLITPKETNFIFRSELGSSSGIAATLQQLAGSNQWQAVVAENISGCLDRLDSHFKVSALFLNLGGSSFFLECCFFRKKCFRNLISFAQIVEKREVLTILQMLEQKQHSLLSYFKTRGDPNLLYSRLATYQQG